MNQRGTSILLIPLVAVLALFFPLTTHQPSPGPTSEGPSQQSPTQPTPGGKPQGDEKAGKWQGGRKLVRDFLGPPPWKDDRRSKSVVGFLVATVPDPVDSGLPYLYDRFLDSVQAALQSQGYVLYKFDLPWQDCLLGRVQVAVQGAQGSQGGNEPDDPCKEKARYRTQPGVILMSNADAERDLDAKIEGEADPDLLLLYLIGETPTGGIHKPALKAALDELEWFCKPPPARSEPPLPFARTASCKQIQLLGPTFTGAAQSLDFVMRSWLDSIGNPADVSFRIISGSATAIKSHSDFRASRPGGNFSATVVPNAVTLRQFLHYLQELEPRDDLRKVALLREGGTAYGQEVGESVKKYNQKKKERSPSYIEVTSISFPLHISQLRAASERARRLQQDASTQVQERYQALPLTQSLEEVNRRSDSVPSLSQLEAPTMEQVLANLLSTISLEDYRYVGILATDARDTLFLANEIHEHSPGAVLFTFDSDLLFLHPQENPSVRGMLLVSSYPLFNLNLLWSPPHPTNIRLQFPDQLSEGVYNATLALLDHEDKMLEYGQPFPQETQSEQRAPDETRPPLWISVVGRNRLWPLRVMAPDKRDQPQVDEYQNYTYGAAYQPPKGADLDKLRDVWSRGIYPHGTIILMIFFTVLCVAFSLAVLNPRSWRRGETHWVFRLLAPYVFLGESRPGKIFLLAACAALGIFQFLALAVFLLPAIRHLMTWSSGTLWLVWTCVGGLVLLFAAAARLLWPLLNARRSEAQSRAQGWQLWVPVAVGSLAIFGFALRLVGSWVAQGLGDQGRLTFFIALRSLDLQSGVSPLVPSFFIAFASFLWAFTSFFRVRMLEGLNTHSGFVHLKGKSSNELEGSERRVAEIIEKPALGLPGAVPILILAGSCAFYFFFFRLVHSFEGRGFYRLFGVAFGFIYLALWLEILRFWVVWRRLQRFLQHLSWHPLRAAYGRVKMNFPGTCKINLTAAPPLLTALSYSVELARTVHSRALSLVGESDAAEKELALTATVGGQPRPATRVEASPAPPPPSGLSARDKPALDGLCSEGLAKSVEEANHSLDKAEEADADGRWQDSLTEQCKSQRALAGISSEVAEIFHNGRWKEMQDPSKWSQTSPLPPPEEVFRLGEDFLASRVVHFLSYVFPQLQWPIYASLAGLLLMLFAITSYPFQPHNLLLLFNWVVILSFAGIAMYVFIEMNRDPVLSSLNGTDPGRITWDREFIFRILTYVVVPVLALLGVQFQQNIGQILTRLLAAGSAHP